MEEHNNGDMKMKGRCMCGCDGSGMGCGCGWHHGHSLFRVLLGLIILAMVFWFGVKIGEIRQEIRLNGYGGYHESQNFYSGMPMMRVYQGGGTVSPATGTQTGK